MDQVYGKSHRMEVVLGPMKKPSTVQNPFVVGSDLVPQDDGEH